MIRAADGLDYEDLAQVLAGKPADTKRNVWIARLRKEGRSAQFIAAWLQAYDGFEGRTGPNGGKVNSFQNAISASIAAEKAEREREQERIAQAHVKGLAADGFYDLPKLAPTAPDHEAA